jgi:hypothetical protein
VKLGPACGRGPAAGTPDGREESRRVGAGPIGFGARAGNRSAASPRDSLVVDDDLVVAESTVTMLGQVGYCAREATDARTR